MTAPQKLGEILMAKGYLKAEQLAAALQEQSQTNQFLGGLLLSKGWITESQLLEALSGQFGFPLVHLDTEPVDWKVAEHFQPAVLIDWHCFPFRMDASSVTVAISNPLDSWAISALEKSARGRSLKLVLTPSREIDKALAQANRLALAKAIKGMEGPNRDR